MHQKAEPLAQESRELLALTTLVARQSRGLPIAPPDDRRIDAALKTGEAIYQLRQGQFRPVVRPVP